MVAGDQNHFGNCAQPRRQRIKVTDRSSIVNQIAKQNQMQRVVMLEQFFQTRLDVLHAPERKQIATRAVANFIAEVQIGHRQPAFSPVK